MDFSRFQHEVYQKLTDYTNFKVDLGKSNGSLLPLYALFIKIQTHSVKIPTDWLVHRSSGAARATPPQIFAHIYSISNIPEQEPELTEAKPLFFPPLSKK